MSTQLLKNAFKCKGSNSFQGISYTGKPQVVSSYSFKSMDGTVAALNIQLWGHGKLVWTIAGLCTYLWSISINYIIMKLPHSLSKAAGTNRSMVAILNIQLWCHWKLVRTVAGFYTYLCSISITYIIMWYYVI